MRNQGAVKMDLKIRNLAKIAEADIELQGLTVIAGANDTGKSTVGKALYAMFHSFLFLPQTILVSRYRTIADTILKIASSYDKFAPTILSETLTADDLVNQFEAERCISTEDILRVGDRAVRKKYRFSLYEEPEKFEELQEQIRRIMMLDQGSLAHQIINNEFLLTFENQINSLSNQEVADIVMRVQKKSLHVQFIDDECQIIDRPITLIHRAIYIDAPYAIDHLRSFFMQTKNHMQSDLANCLRMPVPKNTVVTKALNQQRLQNVMKVLDRTVPGKLEESDGQLGLRRPKWRAPLNVENMSTGMKSFAIIKRLLQNHRLQERDVLILDEPEIHLHPEWQVLYAEFLVLLQQAFHLTVLLTTHSPYFLNAIEVFVRKYGTKDQTRYYLASNREDGAVFEDVTDHTEKIYASLARPFEQMEAMEEELGMDDE